MNDAFNSVDLAIVAAAGGFGETLLELLAEQEFPLGRVFALDRSERVGETIAYGNRELELLDIADFDFGNVNLAIFGPDEGLANYVADVLTAGCLAIDTSRRLRRDDSVPMVVPEINADAVTAETLLVTTPGAMAIAVGLALKPLQQAAGLLHVNVASYQAVSGGGKAAMDELGQQTSALLGFREVDVNIHPRQIAFNVIPQIGSFEPDGSSSEETDIAYELRRLLADDDLAVDVTAVQVPVFFGHAAAVHLQLAQPLTAADARQLLSVSPGLQVLDQSGDGAYPTPVGDASGSNAVMVGRIRQGADARSLLLWVVTDNLRKGCVLNAIQIAALLHQLR